MSNRAVLSFLDYYRKTGTSKVNVTTLTAANFNAQDTLFGTLQTAVAAVSTATLVEAFVDTQITTHAKTPPTDQTSTRASKWLVRAVDQINSRAVTFTIPSADQTLLTNNSPFLDLTSGAGATLKTAVEGYVLSVDGNAITVLSVEYVPRSN